MRVATLICLAICCGLSAPQARAAGAAATPSPEQERAALIKLLQQRLPGSTPADWIAGMSANVPGVAVLPLTPEFSTNFADVLAIGKKTWDQPFAGGKSLAKCFPNAGKGMAANYPQYDAKTQKLVTLERALNDCRTAAGEKELAPAGMGAVLAYARSLSTGQKLNVRVVGPAAQERYESGKAWFQRRLGAQSYACASCHVQYAGAVYREDEARRALPPLVGALASWPRVQPGGSVRTLQMQFQRCLTRAGAEPFALDSPPFDDLEYYLGFLSQGLQILPLSAIR